MGKLWENVNAGVYSKKKATTKKEQKKKENTIKKNDKKKALRMGNTKPNSIRGREVGNVGKT